MPGTLNMVDKAMNPTAKKLRSYVYARAQRVRLSGCWFGTHAIYGFGRKYRTHSTTVKRSALTRPSVNFRGIPSKCLDLSRQQIPRVLCLRMHLDSEAHAVPKKACSELRLMVAYGHDLWCMYSHQYPIEHRQNYSHQTLTKNRGCGPCKLM